MHLLCVRCEQMLTKYYCLREIIYLKMYRSVRINASAEKTCINCDLSRVKLSATPMTARKELYTAWKVESNIMPTEFTLNKKKLFLVHKDFIYTHIKI